MGNKGQLMYQDRGEREMSPEPLNVTLSFSSGAPMVLSAACREQIKRVSPRIELYEAAELVSSENSGDSLARERFDAIAGRGGCILRL